MYKRHDVFVVLKSINLGQNQNLVWNTPTLKQKTKLGFLFNNEELLI